MRIEIEIPKEFEEHFKQYKFKDSLERIMADIRHSLENGDCLCAGRYEHETIEMLQKAFENSRQAYSVDKVVAELERSRAKETCNEEKCDTKDICRICVVDDAIEIVKRGGASDDVCEWESDYEFVSDKYKRETGCGYTFYDLQHAVHFKYCQKKKKKIKVVVE